MPYYFLKISIVLFIDGRCSALSFRNYRLYSGNQQTDTIGRSGAAPPGLTTDQLVTNLNDIHVQRLAFMDAAGVDYMVLSCTSACIQGISDPVQAETLARAANDGLAAMIANNTMRFGAFAALPMHNATVAGIELRRAVTELRFLGALVNDYQQSGPQTQGYCWTSW
jgi:predicted TIM-barrel fold metal-dependent hydrolase